MCESRWRLIAGEVFGDASVNAAFWGRRVLGPRLHVVDCLGPVILSCNRQVVVCEGCFAFLISEGCLGGLVQRGASPVVTFLGVIVGIDVRSINYGCQMLARKITGLTLGSKETGGTTKIAS